MALEGFSTDQVNAGVALVALLFSMVSLYFSWTQHRLAREQEARRKPDLIPDYREGYFTVDPATRARTFHVRLSVSNPTDTDNSVVRIELAIQYRLTDGPSLAVRLPQLDDTAGSGFIIPVRVAAHDAVAGWCRFRLDVGLIGRGAVDSYLVELTDSHGQVLTAQPLLLSEREIAR